MRSTPRQMENNSEANKVAEIPDGFVAPAPLWVGLTAKASIILAVSVVALATCIVFCRVTWFDFVDFDDGLYTFANPHFRYYDLRDLSFFWLHSYQQLYIPLSYTTFGLLMLLAYRPTDYQNFTNTGALLNPHVFHAASLILHLINSILVFLFLRRITRKDLPSLIGSLVFAIHPLQVESVVWISELRGVLSGAFCLASLHLYLTYTDLDKRGKTSAGPIAFVASVVLAAFAMLSKPSSVVICLFVIAIGICVCRRDLRKVLLESIPYAVIGLALGVVTSLDQPVMGHGTALWTRPFIAADTLNFYLVKLLDPRNLTMDYGRTPEWVLSHWWAYAEWIVPVAIVVALYLLCKRAPYLILGSIIALIGLLPVLGLTTFVFQHFSTTADRYMYLPMLGVSIVAAQTVAALSGPKVRYAAMALVVWLAVISVLAFRQTLYWRDSYSLYSHAVAVTPDGGIAQFGLGNVYFKQNMYPLALTHYRLAVVDDPTNPVYIAGLGLTYNQSGDLNDAEKEFRRALSIAPHYSDAHCDLGVVLMCENRTVEGATELQTALRINPSDFTAAEHLGAYYAQSGDYTDAVNVFLDGVRHAPGVEPLWRSLGIALNGANRPADAAQALKIALHIDPNDSYASNLLNTIQAASPPTH